MNKNKLTMTPLELAPLVKGFKTVLYIDTSAGHKTLADAADERFSLVRDITEVLANSYAVEAHKLDIPNLFHSLNVLLDEVQCLNYAAYESALIADRPPKKERGRHAKIPK